MGNPIQIPFTKYHEADKQLVAEVEERLGHGPAADSNWTRKVTVVRSAQEIGKILQEHAEHGHQMVLRREGEPSILMSACVLSTPGPIQPLAVTFSVLKPGTDLCPPPPPSPSDDSASTTSLRADHASGGNSIPPSE